MYARSGDVDAAVRRFQEMELHDVVSWSAVISSHAQHGCAREALRFFSEMVDAKVVPNEITFLGVLTACSHGGLVDEGLRYVRSSIFNYSYIHLYLKKRTVYGRNFEVFCVAGV